VKRLIASLAVGGSLLGGGIAIPLTLTAPAAYAAPENPHSKADPEPNLPVKAQQALIRNGEWDQVAAQGCVFFPSTGLVVCF
jgi:hypothetical protein